MKKAQELLYIWLKEVGEVSYERIKQTCIYLNAKFDYPFEKPIHQFFYPLLYNGVIEFSGNGRFCITPECVITKDKNKHIAINHKVFDNSLCMFDIGIHTSKSIETLSHKNRYDFNLESILTQMPTIESCVLSYPEIYNVKISDFVTSSGVSKKKNDSQRYYFLCPQNGKCYVIPHQSTNPDALNIAMCYGRVVNAEHNGIYNTCRKELRLNIYYTPILIYRALMIESLFYGIMPYIDNGFYVFNNINRKAYSEINRIFCQSIKSI